jgi:transposase-like protein
MEKYDTSKEFDKSLEEVVREGARQMLHQAIEAEVTEFVEQFKNIKTPEGRLIVKRNGYLPEREVQTGIGPLKVKKPRVRGETFNSSILPRYLRRTPSIDALIPALYLKGISTGNMNEALEAILGEGAKGLSAANVTRLKKIWEEEYEEWRDRDLSDKEYVYFWVDGIYFNIRLGEDRPCLLVIIGALSNGKKEMVAIHDGIRESKLSWKTVLQELKSRGLTGGPKLSIGDGALGFWAALEEEFPACEHQRCWVHKTANILDKMAKSIQPDAKRMIHEMYMSPTKEKGLKAMNRFISLYEAKYPKACECLKKDEKQLFSFYDYPAEHWQHIRTTNPIESTFATIRHRSRQTKGCGSRKATLAMVFKLSMSAETHWRKLKGSKLIIKLLQGTLFKDGEEVKKAA